MATTTNEFLNVCINYLENLSDKDTGHIPKSPKTKELKSISQREYDFLDFIKKNQLEINPKNSINGYDLRELLRKDDKDFFRENFLEYIIQTLNIEFKEEVYYGIGKWKSFNDPVVLEAMPKKD